MPRCVRGPVKETNKHIDSYALVGLRTLAVASRELSQEQLASFQEELSAAQQDLENRQSGALSLVGICRVFALIGWILMLLMPALLCHKDTV